MRITPRRVLGSTPPRLAAIASVGAVVAAFAVAGGGAPRPVGSKPAPGATRAAAPSSRPAHSNYVSTEFSHAVTEAAVRAPSKPQPPTQAPLKEVLAQPGHYEHQGANGETDVNVCSYVTAPGYAHCNAHVRTDPHAGTAAPSATIGNGGAYDPAYLRSAYNAPSATGGSGQTVAIAIAYDNPTAEADLATYRSNFGLPPCTAANGCFKKVDQNGGTHYPSADTGWAQESALDTQMVSALCPNCKIVLVEANSSYLNDLGTAVQTAVNVFHANVVSNSYGAGEYNGETTDGNTYYNHPGVAVTVSSGDNGYGVEFPAASKYVTAVGGTHLVQTGTGSRSATETVWNGAGSGCSAFESKPSWQHDTGCAKRAVADVSAVADPNTPVWVYASYGCSSNCWYWFGGTSVAAPIVGAIYALAGGGSPQDTLASYPYGANGGLNDVTSGSNGSCTVMYLCTGVVGYDGPTGLGTPNGTPAFAPAVATPPGAPQPPSVTIGDGKITLTWSPPASTGGSAITSYNIYRGTTSGAETMLPSPVNATTFTDTGLSNGTTYYYQVTAVNGIGEGARSAEVSAVPAVVTPPSVPQSPAAGSGNGTISLAWSVPASNGGAQVTSYNVYRGTSPAAEAPYTTVTGTSLTDSSVTLGTTYYYTVTAVNSAGEGSPSAEVSAAAAKVPGTVTNLVARTATTRGVTLTWSAPAANGSPIQGYKIYRSRSSGTQTYYVTVTCASGSCSYTDTNTTRSAIYYYKIAAFNAIGTASLSKQSYARAR